MFVVVLDSNSAWSPVPYLESLCQRMEKSAESKKSLMQRNLRCAASWCYGLLT